MKTRMIIKDKTNTLPKPLQLKTLAILMYVILVAWIHPSTLLASATSNIQEQDIQITQLLQEGQRNLDQGDFKQASQLFMQILQLQPTHPQALIYLSKCYYNFGINALGANNPRDAEEYFIKAIEYDGQNGEACYNLGVIYDTLAGKYFQTASNINSNDPDTLTQLGIRLSEQGRVDEAERLLLKALTLQINDPASHYNLGVLYGKQQKYWLAIEQFQWLLDRDPAQEDTYLNLAYIYLQLDELEKAIDLYQHLITINPSNQNALKGAGLIALKLNMSAEAKSYLDKYLLLAPADSAVRSLTKNL